MARIPFLFYLPKKRIAESKTYPLYDTPFYLLYYKHNDAPRDVTLTQNDVKF